MRGSEVKRRILHLPVDMQNAYLLGGGQINPLNQRLADFIATTRGRLPLAWVAMSALQTGRPPIPVTTVSSWNNDPLAARIELLVNPQIQATDVVLPKAQRNLFTNPLAAAWLAEQRPIVTTLLLTGVYLDKCVLETAAGGLAAGYEVWVATDLTSSFSHSSFQERAHAQFVYQRLRGETGRRLRFTQSDRLLRLLR